jgi:hypothetical protein
MALGYSFRRHSLETPAPLAKIDGMLHPATTEQTLEYTDLRSFWFHVPLVFEFNPTRNFFISAGGYLDMLSWSDAKWKSPKKKFKDPYINPYQVGVTARIGFRECYFFGNYGFTEFFKSGKGPKFYPYSFGLGFNWSF